MHANRYAVDRDAVHRDAVHRDAVHRDAVHRGFVVSYECDVAVNELKLPPCPAICGDLRRFVFLLGFV